MIEVVLDSYFSNKLKGTGTSEWDYTIAPINQESLSFKSVAPYVLCVDIQYST